MAKILLVEDEINIASFIERGLKEFGHSVTVCHDGDTGWKILQDKPFDLLILDIIMPKINGLELCRLYRQMFGYQIPVIMLTALGTTEDIVKGLDAGADDYVTKPFGMMELVSRIRAVLRRTSKKEEDDTYVLGEIRMDRKKHEVTVAGEPVALTLKEYELLRKLMENQNIVLTRDKLLEEIWGYDFDGETRTVDVHVRTLRQKLGQAGEYIETVRGVGYRIGEIVCFGATRYIRKKN